MATNPVSREDPFPLSSSTYCSSPSSAPIPTSDHLGVPRDPTTRSASNSFQNDAGGFLDDFPASSASTSSSWCYNEAELGFSRSDFGQARLFGTVQFYERHVFLCYKNPSVWPPRVEAAEFDRLPRLLSAAVSSRTAEMKRETRLTICEGHDGTETSNGDVLIFPDMTRYRRLTHFDVDTFVEEVLVKNGEWLPGTPEMLKGSYVFVCCHGSRDRRCGVCGPALISRFKEEIEARSLQGLVSVSACSHIGGHKYAGNVIIFASSLNGGVTGHWYGYVTPDDVPTLLEQHVGKGEIVDWRWRGQMGLTEEEQIQFHELRLQLNGEAGVERNGEAGVERNEEDSAQGPKDLANTATHMSEIEVASCCHQDGESSCCQNPISIEKHNPDAKEMDVKVTFEKKKSSKKLLTRLSSGKGSYKHKVCAMPTWFESWEREDTYAVLAVVFAAVSVTVAYSCYKQLQ